MHRELEALLKKEQYNMYDNPKLEDRELEELTKYFELLDEKMLKHYFTMQKCSSKFCWTNFLKIISKMNYPQKLKGMPILFDLLKDRNWPVFEEAVRVISAFSKEDRVFFTKKYLERAYKEQDEMWADGIKEMEKIVFETFGKK